MKKLSFILFFTLLTQCTLHSQWFQQTVPVNKPITGIKFIDSLRGWACTSFMTQLDTAYVLHTSNGGTNWFIQYVSIAATFGAVSVIDSNIIYAGGFSLSNTANLIKSTNGGINWAMIPTPANMGIDDMVFLNKDSGWTCASGGPGPDVRTTTNGGLNWTVRTSGIAAQTQRIFFLNYTTGFCAANFSLYKTTNAGVSWVLDGNFSGNPLGIFFFNENTGWLSLSGAMIASTTNGGTNWSTQHPFPTVSDDINDIFFVNTSTGYAGTGWFQKILKTTNGGTNWGYQVVQTDSKRISVVDSLNAWAADLGVSLTSNGGGIITYTGITNMNNQIPGNYAVYQNFPNPFNSSTIIKFDLKAKDDVRMIIFDVLGREIMVLVNGKLSAGSYEYSFDAGNLPSGIYFYSLLTEGFAETRKMILIK